MFKFIVCFAILAALLGNVRANVTDESELAILKHLEVYMEQCSKELNLDATEIKKLHITSGNLEGINKCFISCVLKKDGSINEAGKFDSGRAVEALRKVIENADDLKILEAASIICLSVNDEPVSDGDKGCERAYSLLTCVQKQKTQ